MLVIIVVKPIMEFFSFFIWNASNFASKINKGFSNIYNHHDKAYHGFFPFSIWNIYIFSWRKEKGFLHIYNNCDK
jgi:hypothetical protein